MDLCTDRAEEEVHLAESEEWGMGLFSIPFFLYQTYAEKLEQGVASSMIFRFFRLLFFLAWPNFEQLKQNSR